MQAMSGQICPVRRLPCLSVESNIPNEQCHGEIVEANQITPRSKKIDGGSLARPLARSFGQEILFGRRRRVGPAHVSIGTRSLASEGGFNFRRVMRSIKPCKRICLSALLQNGAGLLCL